MIRLLSPDDVDLFRSIRLEALRASPESYASSVEDWQDLPDQEWRRRLVDNHVFIAVENDLPVGIMALARQCTAKKAHRAMVQMVYLRENARGRGLAEALLEALVEFARGQGIRQLELAVSAENDVAIRFYRRRSFTEIGRIPCALLHQGREIDQILMARRIVALED